MASDIKKKLPQMNIVIAGHVDHGKSTIIGRLLADSGSLPEGKLEQVKQNCAKTSRPFEYAFLLDALKSEQAQGITIDSARVFFKTKARTYIIIDAPGHIEFLKNMVSGAARAESAFLVIDAHEGIQENSRRHGYMLSMLGIKQICVLVNKMDLVEYSKTIFRRIVRKYSRFLKSIDLHDVEFIPVSGIEGCNIASLSVHMPWWDGKTVLEQLDVFKKEMEPVNLPFRMSVQDVYKFTKFGDNRRIITGTVETGMLRVGDEVVFYPSGKRSRVKTIETFPEKEEPTLRAVASQASGFTLEEQIYVNRGELAAKEPEAKPRVSSRLKVNLFWLGKKPLSTKKSYFFKLGTSRIPMQVEEVTRVINASTLNAVTSSDTVKQHEVAECILKLQKPISFDQVEDSPPTSRFVIVDNYEIRGGGIIRGSLEKEVASMRQNLLGRNYNWQISPITPEKRAERYNQRSTVILLIGKEEATRKDIGRLLEEVLFYEGKLVYFLGIGRLLSGINADIKEKIGKHKEHI
ncbi:MAG: adenylyl-sulfate kinase, partial [Spirochaetales bacterium]